MRRRYRISPLGDSVPRAPADTCSVSFVVPAFQAVRTLPASIASIRAAAPPDAEVIIVDDGSLDETATLAADLADVLVLRPCQGGAARCRNDGARVARGRVLVFVDSDVTVTPQAVSGLLAHIDGDADAAFGAYEPLPPLEVRNRATTYKNLLHHYTHMRSAGAAQTFWSGFGAIRRDAFWAVHGFDPAVSTGADVEDIHLGYRLNAAGFRIVLDPTLQVRHHKRYTVRGVVVSDVMHRAIPWTRALLQLRTFHADLNLRRAAMISAGAAWAAVGAVLAYLLLGGAVLVFGAASLGAWLILNRGFLRYSVTAWSRTGALACTGFLFLYSLYGPFGAALGTVAHVLRSQRVAQLNWLRLDPEPESADPQGTKPSDDGDVVVTVAVVATHGEPLAALSGLPDPAPWWELVVVCHEKPAEVPPWAHVLLAPSPASTRNAMRDQALHLARGEMFASLDASSVPTPGWLDRVCAAASRGDLVVAGSFAQDLRSIRHRAEQVSRYWSWRPERAAYWSTNHPATNAAFRTDVARALGGFHDEGALLLRMAGFGARPVRFDPGMQVRLSGPSMIREFVPGVGGISKLRAAASSRYFHLARASRLFFAATSPVSGVTDVLMTVRAAVREGTADRTFWRALPVIVAARGSHWVGRAWGLLQPSERGGLVPRSAVDLAELTARSRTT
jgi:GT2 family glycosyltransferase